MRLANSAQGCIRTRIPRDRSGGRTRMVHLCKHAEEEAKLDALIPHARTLPCPGLTSPSRLAGYELRVDRPVALALRVSKGFPTNSCKDAHAAVLRPLQHAHHQHSRPALREFHSIWTAHRDTEIAIA
eukprot:776751-Rhodomonas_salina.2